ncbi:MAG: translation initiation factor IF-2 [Oscillospiraceae bacterium]|nr:translation initiation factor IF-2 [Oscillospiraceae bacterium]
MSNAKQQKQKLSDVAKDLGVTNQELIDLVKEKFDAVKKPAASLTSDEINYILEHFSQNNQVDSFDGYFASRNAPKPAKKEAPKAESKSAPKKKQPKTEEKPAEAAKAAEAPKAAAEKKPAAAKPAQEKAAAEKAPAEKPAQKPKNTEAAEAKPKQQPVQPVKEPPKQEPKPVPVNNAPQQNKADRFNAQQVLKATEQKNKKPQEHKKPQEQQNSSKTKLDIKFADASSSVVDQKIHKVDTRGSYVEMDKYNEKYDNMANVSGGGKHKDNFSKKQKLTQKSQQRKSQQYSSKHETEAEKLRRLELERARKQQLKVLIPDEIVVSELASRLKVTATEVIKKLMGLGEMCTINQVIDFDTASLVAEELGAKVEKEVIVTIEERLIDDSDDDGEGVERAPVVVVMGHVDHGKTSLLDKIRNANVTSTEAGGITQHIGAYRVNYNGKDITFLDTPGHEAFTAMRARGASITDIAILVVAADDGIMPQTVEAINHAKAAGVSIIVAINKMDKPGANPDNVKQQLTEHGLVIEEWGGDVICVPVSAKTGDGIDDLLENVLLVAEVAELKANPNRLAKGAVIEARLDKGRGPIATLLVQNGTLHTGDIIIAGTAVGRVRVMTNDQGKVVKEAGPSYPVEITGLAEVPAAGDTFNAVEDERLARELVEQRKHEAKQEQFKQYQKVTLDNLFSQIEQGEIKELPIIVKADVQGSVEAVKQSLEKLSNEEVRVKVIHGGVGAVSESDVMLADASNAIIVGFNVRPDPVAEENAKRDGVDIRLYRIIYDAIEEIETAMKGMLAPKFREVSLGRVEVRQVYKISNVGTVSGSYVLSGKITRNAEIRVVRDGIIIADDKMSSLKRFKDDVKEVAEGYECGITLEKFNDVKVGDIFEAYMMEEYKAD